MSVTQSLLGPLLSGGSSARPLITHYDGTGRVELSRATVANWAAKTANWLADELDLEPGAPVAVRLPAHWQTAGILLGAWWCGAHVTDDASGAEAAFVTQADVDSAQAAHTVTAVSLDMLGAPLLDLPETVVDHVSEVRSRGDDFTPLAPVPGTTPALLGSTVDEVVGLAQDRAEALGIGDSDRVLSTIDWTLTGGATDSLLAVLAARSSLVQCTDLDREQLDKCRQDERTTVELGLPT